MIALRPALSFRVFMTLAALSLGALAGCAIGSDDIQHWKQTQKGPEKILKVMSSDRYPISLRAEAALAMIELTRADVDGLGELGVALEQSAAQEPEAVEAIVRDLAPRLSAMMKGEPDKPASAEQIRAKDAAFRLIPFAEAPVAEQLVGDVVAFYVEDFPSRSLAGDVSAEQVARKLGEPAVSRMVGALDAKMPPEALVKLTELISELGGGETKARAGARLVEIEREMRGEAYLAWLSGEIDAQEAGKPEPLDSGRRAAMASLNREKFLNQGALAAMKHLAGQPEVAARLVEIAREKPAEDAPEVTAQLDNDRRRTALLALAGHAKAEHLDALLAVALDGSDELELRDLAFDRIAEIGAERAIAPMWRLVQSNQNEILPKRLRWRAGELILTLGGPGIVREFLARLPADPRAEYEPEELAGYATKIGEMSEPPTAAMREATKGPQWYKVVIAANFLAERGEASDRALLEQLAGSRLGLVGDGWGRSDPPRKTVGDVARMAAGKLEKRLSGDSDESKDS